MRAAFYESDITPPLGGYLWGHYNRMHAEDVIDKFYAKAVVTECDGEVAAILAVDTCTLSCGHAGRNLAHCRQSEKYLQRT